MIRYYNCRCSRLFCFQCSFDGHNTFHNKWCACHLRNLTEFFYRLTSCRWLHILKKRKPCCINIHRHCEGFRFMYHLHLPGNHIQIPWFHSRDSDSICFLNRFCCCNHHITVHAISCKCSNSVFCTGRYQNIIICHIIQAVSIM